MKQAELKEMIKISNNLRVAADDIDDVISKILETEGS